MRGDEEGEDDGAERRTCEAEFARLRHGIFSKLTTGRDTLEGIKTGNRHAVPKKIYKIKFGISKVHFTVQIFRQQTSHHGLLRAPFGG